MHNKDKGSKLNKFPDILLDSSIFLWGRNEDTAIKQTINKEHPRATLPEMNGAGGRERPFFCFHAESRQV
jgi:hypothetical protein